MTLFVPILLSLLFSAFFSGSEIAFVSANRLKIELERKQGQFTARLLGEFLKKPSWFIGAMLVGNNIALVFYAIFMQQLLTPWLVTWLPGGEIIQLLVQTLISTFIILVSAEFLPKTVFRINPNGALQIFAIPLKILYYILYLPTLVTVGLSEWLLRVVFRQPAGKEELVFGRIDLHHYVREFQEQIEEVDEMEHELQILQNALGFGKIKVRDCMVPRTEITSCEVEESIDVLKDLFIETGYSKIIIYRQNIDNVIGYIHSNEIFKHPTSIKSCLLPVLIMPETMSANEALELFIHQKRGIAVVVDEFGGTSGMLTMEDIIEEIFGEIEDEHDTEDLIEEVISNHEFKFSARFEIDYLNDKYKLELPESEEYDTLAGLILYYNEDIPEQGEEIRINENFRFKILEVSDARIVLVNLVISEA